VAATLADEFAHDLCFVNLQPLTDPAQLPTALAEALSFPLTGSDPAERQLLRFLANQERLLVLDNFEHLLPSVDFVVEVLAQASGIKLLVTSRELLNIQEEWLFPLAGLAFPPVASTIDSDTLLSYSAVQLFVERVRRVRPQFALQDEAWAVARICQLVEGMPLALELAATWVKSLTCDEVATEIARGLDFLTTNLRNTPERHRSMVVVFQQSWQQLTSVEQPIFARLSVFRGGFDRAAAEQVAGASLPVLMVLVDKSLLRWERELSGHGRYQMHELLRQFAEDQLAGDRTVAAAHAAYYLHFLHERLPAMLGGRQLAAKDEIHHERSNLRVAWDWAVAQGDVAALARGAPALSQFFHMHSHFQEGAELFAAALRASEQAPPSAVRDQAWATLSALLGWLYIRNSRLAEAETLLQESLAFYRQHNLTPGWGWGTDPRLALGILAMVNGQFAQAIQLGEEALNINQRAQQPSNELFAWDILACAQLGAGQVAQAQQTAQRCITLAEEQGERWFVAYLYTLLGDLAMIQQDTATALRCYESSYARHQEFGDQEGMARTLNSWGDIELQQGNHTAAQSRFQQALKLHQTYQDQAGITGTLTRLGYGALLAEEYESARRYLRQALEFVSQQTVNVLTLTTLARIGELLLRVGEVAQSLVTFTYIAQHPACDRHTQQLIQTPFDQARAAITLPQFQAASAAGQQISFAQLTATLLQILAHPFSAKPADPSGKMGTPTEYTTAKANAALIEPLTERELEILHLIAEGQTNLAIADKLILSPGTVKWYSSEIYGKLGVANRTQAVAEARRLKLLP
jgi:predicted ATPase/DNA-binding NarL/FixJ family response regulator/predicted negative regulator of RcsB-dependent stress response